jgi:predicted enzyme related to lactoylglutathione lyase
MRRDNAGVAAGDEPDSDIFRPAGISYLRIPSTDPRASAAFYEAVFGWKVDADREDPSFEDGTGHVIGHIHGDMEVAGEAGIRPYVYVESVEATLERITSNGGTVVTPPYPEGDLTVAVFRDPADNVLGIWQRA